jgi:TPR repeat protein
MHKNEYYRFGDNLSTQISLDEEKAKNGDVDAMIRLAKYFRTGKTIAYDDNQGADAVSNWYEEKYEDGYSQITTDLDGWYANEQDFNRGKTYAKMAADLNDPRGLYQYSFYLRESLDFDEEYQDCCAQLDKEISEFITVKGDDIQKYKDAGIELECVVKSSGEEVYFRELSEYEKQAEQENIDALLDEYDRIRSQIDNETLKCLSDAAALGLTDAQIELGKFYANGEQFACLETSSYREDAASGGYTLTYDELTLIHIENATTDNINTAIAWFESSIKNDPENIGVATYMLGKLYSAENNPQKDLSKAISYYKQAKDHINFYIGDDIVNLFIDNSEAFEFGDILYLLSNKEGIKRKWDGVYKIIDLIPLELLNQHSDEIMNVLLSCGSTDIFENTVIEHCYWSTLGHHSYFLKNAPLIPLDTLQKMASCVNDNDLVDLYALAFYTPSVYNAAKASGLDSYEFSDKLDDLFLGVVSSKAEQTIYAYNALTELAENGNNYAQYKLGRALFSFINGDKIVLEAGKGSANISDMHEMAKRWLVDAYKNGCQAALLDLGLKFEEYRQISLNLQLNGDAPTDILLIVDARNCVESGDYSKAISRYEKWTKSNHSLRYADELLATYEKLNDNSAKNFVDNFIDWVKENEITDHLHIFVNSELIKKLLDKASLYYNPLYAIRILTSPECSTAEGNYLLGCLYSDAEHVAMDHKLALNYFKLAAKEGIGEAYYKLAYMFYYGEGNMLPEPRRAKEYFEKAMFHGVNCEYAYEMVRVDLKEPNNDTPMKEYADRIISETRAGQERNKRIQEDMASDFGDKWKKLDKKTQVFIYSGVKTYIDNYEENDQEFDFSAAINPMAKSLEHEIGNIFYAKYKRWLRKQGIADPIAYFNSLGVKVSSDKEPFTLGTFRFIAYQEKEEKTNFSDTRKLIRKNKLPAIIKKRGNSIYVLQLNDKFAEYANEIFREDAFSKDERPQEITAFIINMVDQVEVVRRDLRNRASHTDIMEAKHAETCGNILYKTKRLLYSLVSKIK